MEIVIDVAILSLMMATAVGIVRIHNLFAVVMLLGIFSLLAALLYVVLDAVDVAFTEAAVGAGISTVLMLGTLVLTSDREKGPYGVQIVPLAVVLVTGAALMYGTLDMPRFGDPNAPAHNHVAPHYITKSGEEVGPPNIVTSVLASYRGFDTLGEVAVIFTAGAGVMTLLGRGVVSRRRRRRSEGEATEADRI
ncbi:MAG: DUF4040 domain-containing protein [Magnetospiraceae bacterium]